MRILFDNTSNGSVNRMIKAGILSDTHLSSVTPDFAKAVRRCFHDCEVIIHAGDITDAAVLDAFQDKTVYAVHGNCCSQSSPALLPAEQSFLLGGFKIGLVHGDRFGRYGGDIEPGLLAHFLDEDCLIYGHTHNAVCRWTEGRLIINPGSFQLAGRYGNPCTYAILEAGEELKGSIHEFPLR